MYSIPGYDKWKLSNREDEEHERDRQLARQRYLEENADELNEMREERRREEREERRG